MEQKSASLIFKHASVLRAKEDLQNDHSNAQGKISPWQEENKQRNVFFVLIYTSRIRIPGMFKLNSIDENKKMFDVI